jgi:hypothetical protein
MGEHERVQPLAVRGVGVDLARFELAQRDREVAARIALELGVLERAGEEIIAGVVEADAEANSGPINVGDGADRRIFADQISVLRERIGLRESTWAARTGSNATKPMSASPFLTLSITGCTPGTPLMVNGTLSRRASSRPRSAAGPLTSPVFASMIACTGLPAMKVARRVPAGTSSSA